MVGAYEEKVPRILDREHIDVALRFRRASGQQAYPQAVLVIVSDDPTLERV